jgi:hypothetical protein
LTALHTLLVASHDRLDLAVVDELSDDRSLVPPGSIQKGVFP